MERGYRTAGFTRVTGNIFRRKREETGGRKREIEREKDKSWGTGPGSCTHDPSLTTLKVGLGDESGDGCVVGRSIGSGQVSHEPISYVDVGTTIVRTVHEFFQD